MQLSNSWRRCCSVHLIIPLFFIALVQEKLVHSVDPIEVKLLVSDYFGRLGSFYLRLKNYSKALHGLIELVLRLLGLVEQIS